MSDRFPQYSLSQFPNSLDSYLIFQDVNISNKPLVDQYYSYINENDFASATQLIEDNPSLKYVIVTANTMQSIYDALMAIETTYSTDVIKTIATCVTSQGEWSSTGSYPIFSIVTSRGTAFMCIKPDCPIGTPVTDTNYWITITMRGESGSSMSFHESYDSTFPYGIQDCVPFANRLYVSITNDNLGNQPDISPDFWSAVISVPTQTIISKNQPTGQDSNGLWYKTNDTNNSYEVNKSNGDNTYSPLFPTSKASYIKTSDGQTIDTALKSNSDLITEHKADTAVHLQAGERDKWNAAAQYPARTNPPVNLDQMFIPVVQGGGAGVMEIGQYIDFHVKGNDVDYDARLTAQTDGSLDGTISHAKDTASLASALTLSTAAPTATLAAGKLWGVYDA